MASTKEYLTYILEQLSGLDDIRYRAMMGEYILYYRGKVVGGVYDNRLLLKPTPSARALLPDAPMELPYEGAKAMLLADADDRELLASVLTAMVDELPAPKTAS
ncbi:MAG: TfoX/Sxy family protein [Oscillospiraceae bacterium]|nr:TfoX/Sxy family protein [Oscillospiraceae bacterium]